MMLVISSGMSCTHTARHSHLGSASLPFPPPLRIVQSSLVLARDAGAESVGAATRADGRTCTSPWYPWSLAHLMTVLPPVLTP